MKAKDLRKKTKDELGTLLIDLSREKGQASFPSQIRSKKLGAK
jgi:ribosomal protein L29